MKRKVCLVYICLGNFSLNLKKNASYFSHNIVWQMSTFKNVTINDFYIFTTFKQLK